MIRDKRHLAFIRLLPCVKCGRNRTTQAAHIRKFTDGGTGLKPSDNYTVPLCSKCHAEQHQKGEVSFWGGVENIMNTIKLANKLYDMDFFQSKRVIMEYRHEIQNRQ